MRDFGSIWNPNSSNNLRFRNISTKLESSIFKFISKSMLEAAIDATVPLTAMLVLGYITYNVYKYVMSLSVTGKPNEWVVLINNGE